MVQLLLNTYYCTWYFTLFKYEWCFTHHIFY